MAISTYSFLVVTLLVTQSSVASQCNETDALLKVSYSITMDEFEDITDQKITILHVRPSGNVGNSSVSASLLYSSYNDLADFESCVPRAGACIEVTVSGWPLESYQISWDNTTVATGSQYKRQHFDPLTSTEVGEYCYPTCDEADEALFEYKLWSGIGFEDYRVEDMDGNKVLGCDDREDECQKDMEHALHKNRACLKRDACYRFISGSSAQWIPGYHDVEPKYTLQWDGETVYNKTSKLFDSVMFGDACTAACNPDESLIEFFMHRWQSSESSCNPPQSELSFVTPEPDISWELRMLDIEDSNAWSMVAKGDLPCYSNTSLYHYTKCVPKDHCASFSLVSPETHKFLRPMYTLTMDGIIYERTGFMIDNSSQLFQGLNQTTYMGGCSVETMCDKDSQALMEVNVMAPSEYIDGNNKSLAAIPDGFTWLLNPTSEALLSNFSKLWFAQDITDLNSKYRTMACIPDIGCVLEFGFSGSRFVGVNYTYKLLRNGIELSDRGRDGTNSIDVTLFGKDCGDEKNSVAGGDGSSDRNAAKTRCAISINMIWGVVVAWYYLR